MILAVKQKTDDSKHDQHVRASRLRTGSAGEKLACYSDEGSEIKWGPV